VVVLVDLANQVVVVLMLPTVMVVEAAVDQVLMVLLWVVM
jgi:hypothetical protein